MILKIKTVWNAYLAFIIYLLTGKKKLDIWLIGGHGGALYQDNSKIFFEYILKNHPEQKTYWITDKNDFIQKKVASQNGEYIIKGSIKNYLYFYRCKKVIFSHELSSDIIPYAYVLFGLQRTINSKVKVFISHGVEGFKCRHISKKITSFFREQMFKKYDLFLSVGSLDKEIKVKYWGIDENKIKMIGMPRYDYLNYNLLKEKEEILLMFTWRKWYFQKGIDIKNTDYYKNLMEILNDDEINQILMEKNIILKVYLHHLISDSFKDIKINFNSNIKILSPEVDLQNEIIKSRLIITDYSSISWDAYYLNKKIIFYRFDLEDYEKEIGSYVDLTEERIGKIVYSFEQFKDYFSMFLKTNMIEQKRNVSDFNQIFEFNDNKNCSRLYDLLKNT